MLERTRSTFPSIVKALVCRPRAREKWSRPVASLASVITRVVFDISLGIVFHVDTIRDYELAN